MSKLTVKISLFVISISLIIIGIMNYIIPDDIYIELGSAKISLNHMVIGTAFVIFMLWTANIIFHLIENRVKNIPDLSPSNRTIMLRVVQTIIYTIIFFITLGFFGIDMSSFAIFGGALGIGLGFGLQKIASNFISGIILLCEKSLEEGSIIELPGGITGNVVKTGARYTLIRMFDGKEAIIPNDDFITGRVINLTYSDKKARIDIEIKISYSSDIKKALSLMSKAAEENKGIIPNSSFAFVQGFRDFGVSLMLQCWVEDLTEGKQTIQSDIMISVLSKFKKNNIEIAVTGVAP